MILLAKEIEGPVSEGWEGLDGIDVKVGRNSYGRQVSFLLHCLETKARFVDDDWLSFLRSCNPSLTH